MRRLVVGLRLTNIQKRLLEQGSSGRLFQVESLHRTVQKMKKMGLLEIIKSEVWQETGPKGGWTHGTLYSLKLTPKGLELSKELNHA